MAERNFLERIGDAITNHDKRVMEESKRTPQVRVKQYPDFKPSFMPFAQQLANFAPALPIAAGLGLIDKALPKPVLTAIDGKPAPVRAAFTQLGLMAMADLGRGWPEVDLYRKATLEDRRAPITEKDFTPQQLADLARATRYARSQGRAYVDRPDHGHEFKPGERRTPWGLMVGRAGIKVNPDGGARVVDTYDFNNYKEGLLNADLDPAVWWGRRRLPSGLRGVPVDINLGMAAKKGR